MSKLDTSAELVKLGQLWSTLTITSSTKNPSRYSTTAHTDHPHLATLVASLTQRISPNGLNNRTWQISISIFTLRQKMVKHPLHTL